jgi:hypothetical protein
MPPKKNDDVSHNLKDIFDAAIALVNCLNIKCKKEQEQLKKNKYVIEKEKLVLNFVNEMKNIKERFKNDKVRGEIEFGKKFVEYSKEYSNLEIKIINEKNHNDLIMCQLQGCYNERLHMLKYSIEKTLNRAKKNTEIYKLAYKYKNMFETTKLTVEDINNFDIDTKKIGLNEILINFEKDMIRLNKKLNI